MGVAEDVRALLRQRGAETIEHPGGTLYAHLLRVHDRLAALGAADHVRLAGLAHAAYGTDGLDRPLVDRTERALLREVAGPDAERLVYRYGACHRARTWQALTETGRVWDRFTGEVETLTPAQAREFVDLSVVNELDVIEQQPSIAERHGRYFRQLFGSWAPLASPPVLAEARRLLPGPG